MALNLFQLDEYRRDVEQEKVQQSDRPAPPPLTQDEYHQTVDLDLPTKPVEKEDVNKGLEKISKQLSEIQSDLHGKSLENPAIVNSTINSLPSDNYELLMPINIILKIYNDESIAILPELELFTEGRDEIEAVANLKLDILDLIEDLEEYADNKLGPAPKSWKKALDKLVKKCR